MSNDDDPEPRRQSVVADVTFTTVSNQDVRKSRPIDSRGGSLKQEKDKWSARGERFKDKLLTPPRSLSSRKSEEIQGANDGRSGTAQQPSGGAQRSLLEHSTSRSSRSAGKRRMDETNANRASRASCRLSSRDSSLPSVGPSQLGRVGEDHRLSKMPSMDPAQLVQMALNLSESRKRHSSNPITPFAPNAAIAHRASSAGALLQPSTGEGTDVIGKRIASQGTQQQAQLLSEQNAPQDGKTEPYQFSPATLARAERARRYFELADQHRRLLQQLPALSTSHRPRPRASSHLSTRQGQIGRAYNPLQALRNRGLREQQKDTAACLPEQFMDLDKVEQWVVEVENARSEVESPFQLPIFHPSSQHAAGSALGHRHNKTADTVITKQDHAWYISPAELLADTYWTEQRQNKASADSNRKRKDSNPHDRRLSISVLDQSPAASSTINDTPDKVRHTHRLIPLSAANRLRQHGFTRRNRSDSMSSTSSAEGLRKLPNDINIGPLQRHMDEMIRKDAEDELQLPIKVSPDHWNVANKNPRGAHRMSKPLTTHHKAHNGHAREATTKLNGNTAYMQQMVSSPDSSQPNSPTTDRFPALVDHHDRKRSTDVSHHSGKTHPTQIRSKDAIVKKTSSLDEQVRAVDDDVEQSRLSAETGRPSIFRRHKTTESLSSSLRDMVHSRSKTTDSDMTSKEQAFGVTRFLKGGRLGEMVRTESSKFGHKLRGREKSSEEIIFDASAINSEASDTEGAVLGLQTTLTSAEVSDASPRASMDKLKRPSRYHLPSFRSQQARGTLSTIHANDSADHITRQQADLRKRNRSPRFERLAPPRIALPPTSQDSQRLTVPVDSSSVPEDHRRSYGFLNPALRSKSRSHSRSRPLFGRGRSGLKSSPPLSPISTRSNDDSRHWSISDHRPPGIFTEQGRSITSRDVARVQALLLASGIKAREISRRLEVPPAMHSSHFLQAARLCCLHESEIQKRPRKEEYTYAVELLASFVDDTLSSLSSDLKTFQTNDLQSLISRQDALKSRFSEDLTELVHGASDQADAFNIDLSTQATLRTKQVDDAINAVLRLRRRQFRLLRQTAFKLLEWSTLSLLYWIWFFVVCFKTMQRIVIGIFKLVRWLFTF